MSLARIKVEGAPLNKAYPSYVVERGRLITHSKNFIWKPIGNQKLILTDATVDIMVCIHGTTLFMSDGERDRHEAAWRL